MTAEPEAELLDLPPEAGEVRKLYVWIGIHHDGREAMLSADMPMAFGTRHAPLMSSRREVAEALAPLADKIRRAAMHRADRLIRVELRTFEAKTTPPSFTCPRCGAVSYNPNDMRERYCRRCQVFCHDFPENGQ